MEILQFPSGVNPLTNMLSVLDNINSAIYTGLSQDPLLGILTKALPPPPKISTALSGVQLPQLPKLPGVPSTSEFIAQQQVPPIQRVPPSQAQFG